LRLLPYQYQLSISMRPGRFIRLQLPGRARQGDTMSFGLYSIGFAILIGGLIYGAHLMHMPARWIVVGAIVLLGAGILSGVKATRQRDSAE